MKKIKTKIGGILIVLVLICANVFGQTSIKDLNSQLRDVYQNLKRPPDSVPFLFDMSSHILSPEFFSTHNDSDVIVKSLFLGIYEEMRESAYDTSILLPTDSIEHLMRDRTTNDTVNLAILNADYATFYDSAFTTEGQYYTTTDSSIADVSNRTVEPFILKNTFAVTLTTPVSYFKKVVFILNKEFIFTKNKLLNINSKDLDPNYARWKIDFGDGGGWRAINPLAPFTVFSITYPDTGRYDIKLAIFYCDPYPNCNTSPSKLSLTSVFILNNVEPRLPDLTYEFPNVTVGLYKGCGDMDGTIYIPQKPIIIIEGIDLLNTTSIPQIYEDYIKLTSDKRLGQLTHYNYDFYIVNFNNTRIDLRDNAQGVIALIEYLKSIMVTKEQFVVVGESMGGVIARFVLTYMETDTYKNDPSAQKPEQMHNTRLFISNDAPHQGATVPIAYQIFYKNIQSSMQYNLLMSMRWIFPMFDNEIFWINLLKSKSIKQLLAYHIDANGPHPDRLEFMDELIGMKTSTNGYPEFCKMIALTDGLLSGQGQLKLNNALLHPGDDILKVEFQTKIIIFRYIEIPFSKEILQLKAVNVASPGNHIVETSGEYCGIKIKGCLRKLLRLQLINFVNCAVTNHTNNELFEQLEIPDNFDTNPASLFPTMALLTSSIGSPHFFKFPFGGGYSVDEHTGVVKATITTSKFIPFHYVATPQFESKITIASLGFAFIPVRSAIDFDYYNVLDSPSNANLVAGNIQTDFLAYTPFHMISGFNYYDINYPDSIDVSEKNLNWSHGYFKNTSINAERDTGYLTREIGDSRIYINNLDLGTRSADFTFGEILVGVRNPHYEYVADAPPYELPNIKYTYSKQTPFKFREPATVNVHYEISYDEGEDIVNEGVLNHDQTTIRLCEKSYPKSQLQNNDSIDLVVESQINSFPNPFNESLKILDLTPDKSYIINISNIYGQLIFSKVVSNEEDVVIESSELRFLPDAIYNLLIYENGVIIYRNKIFKIK